MADPALTDAEKKTAVLVELVSAGAVDLDSIADQIVSKLPADFDPSNPTAVGLGGGTGGSLLGPWFALFGLEEQ